MMQTISFSAPKRLETSTTQGPILWTLRGHLHQVSWSPPCTLQKYERIWCLQSGLVRGFLPTIKQHSFFLMYIKFVATPALSMPENLTGALRETCSGQVSVCTPQLQDVFRQGARSMNPPAHSCSYADSVYHYLNDIINFNLPIMGATIPWPPAPPRVFPPDVPSNATLVAPSTTVSSSTAASSSKSGVVPLLVSCACSSSMCRSSGFLAELFLVRAVVIAIVEFIGYKAYILTAKLWVFFDMRHQNQHRTTNVIHIQMQI